MEKRKYVYKCPNHAVNLNSMRLNNKWCDVTIRVHGKEFHAHKVILAANLKYFETTLSNSSQESKEGVINMESLNASDVEAFLTYAYTGEILLTDKNALNLLEIANYLSEEGISKACIDFLERHLTKTEACRAYKFANTIDCLSLRNVAKTMIITYFLDCSKMPDYLDFDCKSLVDILSGGKTQPTEAQEIFFESIMQWIMHDVKSRKMYLNDLLNCIDIAELTSDYVIGYLYGNEVCRHDDAVIKDVMFCYHTNKSEQKKQEQTSTIVSDVCCKPSKIGPKKERRQTLVIVGDVGNELHFQFYDFTEKKWSALEKSSIDSHITSGSAVLNGKLHYMSYDSKVNNLQMFDPKTKQSATLHSSSAILSDAAVCACDRFLYFCGGRKKDCSVSDQVLRYDPRTNSLDTLAPMKTGRDLADAIFYQGCVYVMGGRSDGSTGLNLVEKYDFDTKKWTTFPSMCKERYRYAGTVLNEKLYVCGGRKIDSFEVYDPTKNSWQLLADMKMWRNRFVVVAHEGKLLAIGGDMNKTVEVYDPSKNQWQLDHQMSWGLKILYPRGGFIYGRITSAN